MYRVADSKWPLHSWLPHVVALCRGTASVGLSVSSHCAPLQRSNQHVTQIGPHTRIRQRWCGRCRQRVSVLTRILECWCTSLVSVCTAVIAVWRGKCAVLLTVRTVVWSGTLCAMHNAATPTRSSTALPNFVANYPHPATSRLVCSGVTAELTRFPQSINQ